MTEREFGGTARTWCGQCLTWTETLVRELIDAEYVTICAHCGRMKRRECGMATYDGNDQPEIVYDFLLALLYDAGGTLEVSREAADWVHQLRQRGATAGYRTEGSPDGSRLTLHLVSPDHPAT